MNKALIRISVLLCGLVVGTTAQATIINGGFETGTLAGWTSTGAVSVVGGAYGTGPIAGSSNALIETGFEKSSGSSSTGVTDAAIETFLGLTPGTLDTLSGAPYADPVTEGSAIKQTFSAAAGDTISFDFIVLADDCDVGCPGGVEDYGFVTLLVDGVAALLTTTFGTTAAGSPSPYFAESGVMSFSHTLGVGGSVTLGVAMLDGGDTIVPSALLVDNFSVTSVPEPATLMLMGLGLAGFGALRRKRV